MRRAVRVGVGRRLAHPTGSLCSAFGGRKGSSTMPDSVYRVTEVIGTSTESWEAAARTAVETAARTVRDLRIAEVVKLDVTIENGKVTTYRARLNISFKYDTGD
jgi:flavin-binding protein dodecin